MRRNVFAFAFAFRFYPFRSCHFTHGFQFYSLHFNFFVSILVYTCISHMSNSQGIKLRIEMKQNDGNIIYQYKDTHRHSQTHTHRHLHEHEIPGTITCKKKNQKKQQAHQNSLNKTKQNKTRETQKITCKIEKHFRWRFLNFQQYYSLPVNDFVDHNVATTAVGIAVAT